MQHAKNFENMREFTLRRREDHHIIFHLLQPFLCCFFFGLLFAVVFVVGGELEERHKAAQKMGMRKQAAERAERVPVFQPFEFLYQQVPSELQSSHCHSNELRKQKGAVRKKREKREEERKREKNHEARSWATACKTEQVSLLVLCPAYSLMS
jgi:hypothetical protein